MAHRISLNHLYPKGFTMSATIKYVKPEHVEILQEYLSDEGVALIFPEAQKKAKRLGMQDGDQVNYDFGGEADTVVEKVSNTHHYLLQKSKEELCEHTIR